LTTCGEGLEDAARASDAAAVAAALDAIEALVARIHIPAAPASQTPPVVIEPAARS
jgi:hypothetical protein